MLDLHPRIIRDRAIVADDWAVLRLDGGADPATVAVPEGRIIVPLAVWLAQRAALAARAPEALGVWIAPHERPEALAGALAAFAVVAVDFPKFSDGRGYSIAYNLRRRLGWTGELRAIGDVLRDNLFAMQRCGFNAFATRPDRSIEDALLGLTVFSETYQAAVDNPLPLFRRHARGAPADLADVAYGI
jgi:uncharacterized protein (DUF934 family)